MSGSDVYRVTTHILRSRKAIPLNLTGSLYHRTQKAYVPETTEKCSARFVDWAVVVFMSRRREHIERVNVRESDGRG